MAVTSHKASTGTKERQSHKRLTRAGVDTEGEAIPTQLTCTARTGNKSEKNQIATMNQSACSMALFKEKAFIVNFIKLKCLVPLINACITHVFELFR